MEIPKLVGAGKLFEPLVIFIRDEIAIPNIGPKYHKYISYLLTIFFFILFLNILRVPVFRPLYNPAKDFFVILPHLS